MSGFLAALAAIVWLHDEAKAVRQSRATGKPMLIDFRTNWCSACKMLDKHTWADPAVQEDEIKARFVPLSLERSVQPGHRRDGAWEGGHQRPLTG